MNIFPHPVSEWVETKLGSQEKSEECRGTRATLQREADECTPATEAARKALLAVERAELKDAFKAKVAPAQLRRSMEVVCLLLGRKWVLSWKSDENWHFGLRRGDWGSAKVLASEPEFLREAADLEPHAVHPEAANKLRELLDDANFVPDAMDTNLSRSLCVWLRALHQRLVVAHKHLPLLARCVFASCLESYPNPRTLWRTFGSNLTSQGENLLVEKWKYWKSVKFLFSNPACQPNATLIKGKTHTKSWLEGKTDYWWIIKRLTFLIILIIFKAHLTNKKAKFVKYVCSLEKTQRHPHRSSSIISQEI
jgi:hypothetical protein